MRAQSKNHASGFDWMRETIYEPRADAFAPEHGVSRGWRIFTILALLAVVVGALIGSAMS